MTFSTLKLLKLLTIWLKIKKKKRMSALFHKGYRVVTPKITQ